MTTNFPSSIDAFTNPTSADTLDNPPHDQQHADINDAMEAVQTKIGVDNSAVTTSLDYLVRSAMPVGSVIPFAGASSPDVTWLVCDGSAVSRTTYAALFAVFGTTYGTGDGSTTFNVPNMKGRVPVGIDYAQTEFDTLGEASGEKTHTLTSAESGVPEHTHNFVGAGGSTNSTDTSHSHANSLTGTTSFATTGHNHTHISPIGKVSGGLHALDPADGDMDAYGSSVYFNTIQTTNKKSIGTPSSGAVERWQVSSSGPSATATVGISNVVVSQSHSHSFTPAGTVQNNASASATSAHNNLQPYLTLNYIIKAA